MHLIYRQGIFSTGNITVTVSSFEQYQCQKDLPFSIFSNKSIGKKISLESVRKFCQQQISCVCMKLAVQSQEGCNLVIEYFERSCQQQPKLKWRKEWCDHGSPARQIMTLQNMNIHSLRFFLEFSWMKKTTVSWDISLKAAFVKQRNRRRLTSLFVYRKFYIFQDFVFKTLYNRPGTNVMKSPSVHVQCFQSAARGGLEFFWRPKQSL